MTHFVFNGYVHLCPTAQILSSPCTQSTPSAPIKIGIVRHAIKAGRQACGGVNIAPCGTRAARGCDQIRLDRSIYSLPFRVVLNVFYAPMGTRIVYYQDFNHFCACFYIFLERNILDITISSTLADRQSSVREDISSNIKRDTAGVACKSQKPKPIQPNNEQNAHINTKTHFALSKKNTEKNCKNQSPSDSL